MTDPKYPLIAAVKAGDHPSIRQLASPQHVNEMDSQGWTPLFHAAHRGDVAALGLLIRAGANVNQGERTGFTALFSAVLGGHVEAAEILIDAGARETSVDGLPLTSHARMIRNPRKREHMLILLQRMSKERQREK